MGMSVVPFKKTEKAWECQLPLNMDENEEPIIQKNYMA